MCLSAREQRLLDQIGEDLGRSDPRLASKLAAFGRRTAGEAMPGREQLRTLASRARAALRAAATAAATLIAWAAALDPRAGLTRPSIHELPKENTMRPSRHPSPLPPDPVPQAGGSPLPPDPVPQAGGSPLPPDPVPRAGGSPLPPGPAPVPGPGEHPGRRAPAPGAVRTGAPLARGPRSRR